MHQYYLFFLNNAMKQRKKEAIYKTQNHHQSVCVNLLRLRWIHVLEALILTVILA